MATSAGLRVLRSVGTAVEAAFAAASTTAFVYPHVNGIGGDNFWLVSDARTQTVRTLIACGGTGAGCTIDAYAAAGHATSIKSAFMATTILMSRHATSRSITYS